MGIYEALGMGYVVLATAGFTAAWMILLGIALVDLRRRYRRGEHEERRDLAEQQAFREMARNPQ